MDSLPKLLPSWNDISLQHLVRRKGNSKYAHLYSADYGGIGVDVTENSSCTVPKYFKSQIQVASEKCALPFFPAKQIHSWKDPCLDTLDKEKLEFDRFCMRLTVLRKKTQKSFRSKLIELQKKADSFECNAPDKEVSILVKKHIAQLVETFPKCPVVPTFNVDYAGGNLAVCNFSDKITLVHPSTSNLNKLCITPLLRGDKQCFTPHLSDKVTVKLKKEPILQIDPALEGVCVRQKSSFHLLNLSDGAIQVKTVNNIDLHQIAANPYNAHEILSVNKKGIMKLKNMTTRKTTWKMLADVFNAPPLFYPIWLCSFGSHPFSAMCSNDKKLYSFDLREKVNSARVIFDTENPSFYMGEELRCLRQWNKNQFQYFLTSTHHLTLCDERYPKTPVMYWNHCLNNPPMYLECADLDSNVSVIVVATQRNPELAAFLFSHQGNLQPVSLSSPLMLSSPSDCIDSLKFHCNYIEDKLSSRFSMPLTGICVVPNSPKSEFTVLQSTSLGDIFYQDFKQSSDSAEKTYRVSTGCVLTPPEKILPHLNEVMLATSTAELTPNEDISHFLVNIEQILTPPKEISSTCTLCTLENVTDDKNLVLSDICPMCKLNNAESEHFKRSLANDYVIIGPASQESSSLDCDIDYLSTFDDKYSKRMLSVWLDTDAAGESQTTFTQEMSLM